MAHTQKVGWIGMGRMGYPMAERLLKAGYDVSIWNRTRSKAEPLAKIGGKVVDKLSDLAGMDVVFSIVAEGKDVEQVYLGKDGVLSGNKTPGVFVDCSTISVEESADIRKRLTSVRRSPATPRSSRPASCRRSARVRKRASARSRR